jgi:iron complex transport system ATP-binding protein
MSAGTLVDLQDASVDLVIGARRWTALAPLTWRVEAGERWVVLGPNGAGKSTLMSLAAAVRFPTSGRAVVLGQTLGRSDLRELRRSIGLVTSALGLSIEPTLTGADLVRTGPTATWNVLRGHEHLDARPWLEVVGAAELAERPWGRASQGERARMLLARALAARPRLLVLDEAAAGVDLVGRELLLAGLDALLDSPDGPEAWIHVTHHLEEVPCSTTHAMVLAPGRVLSQGPIGDVLTSAILSAAYGLSLDVRGARGGRWSVQLT